MRRLAKYVGLAVIAVGVLIPVVAWWTQGSNRRQLVSAFPGFADQPAEPAGIRVQAETIQGIDVAASLEMWIWRLRIDFPLDASWKHGWLVVKKKGETTQAFHAGPIEWENGRPKTWDCLIAITPTQPGTSPMSSDTVSIRLNGMGGQLIENPFKATPGGMALRSNTPKFVGNQAVLAVMRTGGGGISGMDSEDDLKRIAEYDAVLLLVLEETFNPPPVRARK